MALISPVRRRRAAVNQRLIYGSATRGAWKIRHDEKSLIWRSAGSWKRRWRCFHRRLPVADAAVISEAGSGVASSAIPLARSPAEHRRRICRWVRTGRSDRVAQPPARGARRPSLAVLKWCSARINTARHAPADVGAHTNSRGGVYFGQHARQAIVVPLGLDGWSRYAASRRRHLVTR